MTHILARITLKSGAVLKLRVDSISATNHEIKWTGLRTDGEHVIKIMFDEIAAVTTEKKWF